MALNFILAGAQLAMGAGKSYMGHQQQQAQYRQAKSAAKRQNNLQRSQLSSNYVERIDGIMDQQQAIADAFGARVNKGLQDIKFLDEFAASRFMIRQEQLNRAFAAQALTDQASSIKLAQSQGVAAASGQSGVTAARRDFVSPLAAAGRNRRIQALQVTGLIDDFDMQSEIDNKQFAHQKYSIGQRAAVLPRFGHVLSQPTMPQMQQVQNPGSMGLYMGLAQAGMSAVSTLHSSLQKVLTLSLERDDSYLDKLMAEPYNPLGGSQLMEQIQYDPRVNVDIGQPLEALTSSNRSVQ